MERVRKSKLYCQRGYTLVEIVGVLVIFTVLAAVVVPRYVNLEAGARQRAIEIAVGELNGREGLTWVNQKISVSGYVDDFKVYGAMEYTIDPEYTWDAGDPTVTGGTLNFKGASAILTRTVSDRSKPAVWRKSP